MSGGSTASLSAAKWAVLGAWTLGALSFLGPREAGLVAFGRSIFWLLAFVHAIECLAFLPRLRRAPGSLAHHLGQTFLFGILHLREISASQGASGGARGD